MNSFKNHQVAYSINPSIQSQSGILVIIDSAVEDADFLRQGIVPQAQTITLNSHQDGIVQIHEALQQNRGISSLHIISHGAPGSLQLGNTNLSLDTLGKYATYLQNWSLQSLLLYGCNVAAGDAGAEFIEKLHRLTSAEIAASANPTGNSTLGGDWQLEVTTNNFNVELAVTPQTQAAYSGVFATPIDDIEVEVINLGGTGNQYTLNGVDYTFRVDADGGNNLQIQSFTINGNEVYLAGDVLDNFELRRNNNPQVTGERQLVWFEEAPGSTDNNVQLRSSFVNTMEDALFGDIVNRGTDNIFDNFQNGEGNFNNIERVDYISNAGITVPADPTTQGFLILERGGNDAFGIAPITELTGGLPSAFGALVEVDGGDWGNSTTEVRAAVLRQDQGDANFERSTTVGPQDIAGVYISFEDLGLATDDNFFGYALFPGDVEPGDDLVDFASFPTDTSEGGEGGLDLIAGGVVFSLTGANEPPVAVNNAETTTLATAVTINVLDGDSDPDNGPAQIGLVEFTQPTNGVATLDDGGTPNNPTDDQVIYTPNAEFTGEDTFEYTISDGADTATALVTITVTAGNTAPDAVDDEDATPINTLINLAVLGNDTDPEDDPLTITEIATPPISGTAVINNGGTPDDPSDDTIDYTPNLDFVGIDTFEYTIDDGN
ncbi:MAG: DUF4347 domain-containing protein, partial [Microcoleaceae cyanobacterium]